MICRFCGNENNDRSTNCYICGKALTNTLPSSLVDIKSHAQAQPQSGVGRLYQSGSYSVSPPPNHNLINDTGGGAQSGPQQFGNQILAGETTQGKSKLAIVLIVVLLIIVAALAWYILFYQGGIACTFSPGEIIEDDTPVAFIGRMLTSFTR
ncbi:MAG: hypothetical protein IJP17_05175 [Clostridia bacterium]|nr:hypothetical protein [Clostridia bacterium]